MNVLVVGAGLAGLTAGRRLVELGHQVRLVDRGRQPGGRLATKRILDADADRPEHASLAFDHGAQYFTVRDRRFAAEVEAWLKARVVAGVAWEVGRVRQRRSRAGRGRGDALGRRAGDGRNRQAPGRRARRGVRRADRRPGTRRDWIRVALVRTDRMHAGIEGPYDAVIVAVPAPEALPLVAGSPELTAAVSRVRTYPCWAALVAFADGSMRHSMAPSPARARSAGLPGTAPSRSGAWPRPGCCTRAAGGARHMPAMMPTRWAHFC